MEINNGEIFDAWKTCYDKEYSTGEYCHETSFMWGLEEGVDWILRKIKDNAEREHFQKMWLRFWE